jgi:hypothetical protein
VLRWPHGGHGDCASARAGYGVRRWAWPAGADVGGRFTALQRRQRCCRFEAFTGAMWKVLRRPDDSANAENASLAQECGLPCTGGGTCIRATMPHPRGGYGRRFGRSAVCAASRRRSHIGSTSEVSLCVGKLESRLKTQDHKGPLNSRLKITQHLLTHDSRSLSNS